MLKRINPHWSLFLTVLMAVTFGSQAVVTHAATPKADQVKAAYIIDAQSGQAVYAQNPDEKLPIASLSKLMTLYLVEQAIKKGQIKWSDQVPLSKGVRKMATSATLSVMPMPAKEQFTVKELFAATLVGSSNSGAIALGEYVGGDNAKFVKLMNQQAKRWSLDATFVSASGLDNTDLSSYGYDLPGTDEKAQNLVSARAITTIARHLINEFPDVLKVANQTSVKIHKYRVPTSVQILKGQKYYDPDVPVDGLKTGYTNQAGGCLVATYRQGGRRMIATTLGAEWKFSADHNLRLKLKQTERFHTVLPKTINYQVPGTQTKVRLVTDDQRDFWENQRQPFLRSEQPVWPLHRTQPNYLAAGTAVLRVRLSDPLSGTSHTVTYRTPQAVTLLGPLHWATTTPKQVEAPLAGAFALAF